MTFLIGYIHSNILSIRNINKFHITKNIFSHMIEKLISSLKNCIDFKGDFVGLKYLPCT